jgi:predicted esterase
MKSPVWIGATALALAALGQAPAPEAEDPVALVRAYFAAPDDASRATAAASIAAHPGFRPSRLREWLHAGYPFAPQVPGLQAFSIDIGGGLSRRVALVVPEGYRPDRAWPLVYALHPSGMSAEEWARQMVRTLGRRAREFLIASPEFEQNYIFAKPPFVPEHPAILDAVARRVHVSADRVYPFGYSKGGFGAWFVALYYPDRVAGAIAMASGFDVAPGEDGFWKLLVRNVAHTPVVNAWGGNDPLRIPGLDEKPGATFAESNRLFEREVRGMGLPVLNIEVPGGGHSELVPPAEPLVRLLEQRRKDNPGRVDHAFRHLHQASCYWLEGISWTGESWGDPPPALSPREGESTSRTIARTLEPLLGRLTGTIDGQSIAVTRQHIGDLVVWLGDSTIDWSRAVSLTVDGKAVFAGRVARDVGVALARARATMDFDSLRFAGIRVDESGKASVVTAASMPLPAWASRRAAAR